MNIASSWSYIKVGLDNSSLSLRYTEDTSYYYIFAFDSSIFFTVELLKGSDPDTVDFETNYQPDANAKSLTKVNGPYPEFVTGSVSGSSALDIPFSSGAGNVTIYLSGTFAGIVNFYLSYDGTTFVDASGMNLNNYDGQLYSGCDTSTFPSGGGFRINATGAVKFRATGSISGTTNIVMTTGTAGTVIDQIMSYVFVKQAGSDVFQTGGIYNSTPPTLSNGDKSAFQLDSSGNLMVTGSFSPPAGGATSAKQDTGNNSLASIDTKTLAAGQAVMASSSPVVIASNQSAIPASQSGTWTVQPGNTANTTAWKVDGSAVTQPISGTVTSNAGTNLNTSLLALESTQTAQSTLIGAVTESAPASDTASSGLNGRLQRVAQRITSLIALIPTSLGQKTMANSFAITVASDQSNISIIDRINTSGTSAHFNGTATTSNANVPSSDGNNIISFIIENRSALIALLVSIDNGTTFKTVDPGCSLSAKLAGAVKHIVVKSASSTVSYESLINRE